MYRKRLNFKRRRYNYRRKKYGGVGKLRKELNRMKKDLRPEMKTHDRAAITTNLVANTPAVYSVFAGMSRDTTDSGYSGNEFKVKSVEVKGELSVSTAVRTNYKFVIALDRKMSGAGPPTATWDTVFTADKINSFRHVDYIKRYKVLGVIKGFCIYDVDGQINIPKLVKWYKKVNIPVTMETSDADNAVTNDIVVLLIADGAVDLSAGIYVRVRYTDN